MPTPHVVVIGGGFGGLAAVQALKRADVRVTLIDKRNHHLFQPLLYQVATANLAPSDIAEPLRAVLSRQANADVLLGEVTRVDLTARTVHTAEQALRYDHLIVAAGMRSSYFGHADWPAHAPGLKTIGDALEIRRRVLSAFERAEWTDDPDERNRLLTFVVIGAGPTGVELAGAIKEIACKTLPSDFRHVDPRQTRVVLVEAGPAVLPPFVPELQAAARAALEQMGVEVRTGARLERLTAEEVVLSTETLRAATVLWAAGVRGVALGEQLGVPVDRAGRVPVQLDLTLADHPEVYVIGDLAHFQHGTEQPLPGVAPVALQMGVHAAQNLLATVAGRPRAPFTYVDRGSLATIGRSLAVADFGWLRLTGFLAWLIWVFVHLMTLVGHRSRAVVFVKWAWAWWTSDRGSRLLWQGEPNE
jgi:NADH dehydrogenase